MVAAGALAAGQSPLRHLLTWNVFRHCQPNSDGPSRGLAAYFGARKWVIKNLAKNGRWGLACANRDI